MLPTLVDGGVQSKANVTDPVVPNRVPVRVCSMYCIGIDDGQLVPQLSVWNVVCVQTNCVFPSVGVKVPACSFVLPACRAASSKPQRCALLSLTVTTRCCLTPGV